MMDGRDLLRRSFAVRLFGVVAAALISVSAAFVYLAIYTSPVPERAQASDDPSPHEMRRAMSMLHEEHTRISDFVEGQRRLDERKARDEEKARQEAKLAAEREAAARLAAERAAEERRRLAEANAARNAQASKPKQGTQVAATAPAAAPSVPLDIVPAPPRPRGPVDAVVATVGEIKDKTVSTITGIKDWFVSAGDKLLGRPEPIPPRPNSRFSSFVE